MFSVINETVVDIFITWKAAKTSYEHHTDIISPLMLICKCVSKQVSIYTLTLSTIAIQCEFVFHLMVESSISPLCSVLHHLLTVSVAKRVCLSRGAEQVSTIDFELLSAIEKQHR